MMRNGPKPTAAPRTGGVWGLAALGILLALSAFAAAPAARGEISDEEKARLFQTADRCCESVRRVSFRYEWFMRSGDIEASSRRDGYAHFDLEGNRYYLSYDHRSLWGDQLEPYTHRQDLFNGEVFNAEYDPKKKIPKTIDTGPMPEKYDDIIALSEMLLDPILFCVMDHRDDDNAATPAGAIKKYAIPLGDAVRKMSFREITGENGERLIRGDFKGERYWYIVDFDPAYDYRWIRIATITAEPRAGGNNVRLMPTAREWTEIDGIFLPTAIEQTFDRGTFNAETREFVPVEGMPISTTQIRVWDYKLGDETDDFYLRDIPNGTEVFDRRDRNQSFVWKDGKVVPGKTKKAPRKQTERPRARAQEKRDAPSGVQIFRRCLIGVAILLLIGSGGWKIFRFLSRKKA